MIRSICFARPWVFIAGLLLSLAGGVARAATLEPGDLLLVGGIPSGVHVIDPATGALLPFSEPGAFIGPPNSIAVDADRSVLVIDSTQPATVLRLSPSGTVARRYTGTFYNPLNVAVEPTGGILVSDQIPGTIGMGVIHRLDPVSGAQSTVSSGGSLTEASSLAVGPGGLIYATSRTGVIRIDPVTGTQTPVSSGGNLVAPIDIAIDDDGSILVADDGADAIIDVDPVTGAQRVVSSGGRLSQLRGIDAEGGSIFVGNIEAPFSAQVLRIDPATGVQTPFGNATSNIRDLAAVPIPEPAMLIVAPAIALLAMRRRKNQPLINTDLHR